MIHGRLIAVLGRGLSGVLMDALFFPGESEALGPEQHPSMGRVEHAGGETGFFIGTLSHGIAFQHFQGELAAATLTGDVFDLLQHLLGREIFSPPTHHAH